MKLNTFRNQQQERDPEAMTYWKRRFVALATGLAVAAAMAWAFSGVLGASGVSDAATGHLAAAHDGSARTSGSAGETGSAGRTRSAGKGTAGPGSGARALDGSASGAAQRPASRTMRPCKPGDVVLSLFASQGRYPRGQLPQFDVDVVSVANRSCAFNVGRKFLSLAVRAHGKRIWDSSDCASGRRSQVIKLARGVPAILPVTWHLDRSSARWCAKTSHPALTGRFAASAAGDGLASNTVTFRVR
jgi:hypothetical protein